MTNPNPMRARRRRHRRAGFTLIEVMVSLGVMTVGALGIIALQQHTIRSNSHARQLTTAMQIAQRWVERFKQDAATWNQLAVAGGAPTPAQVLAGTRYLSAITATPDAFQIIPNTSATVSNAFDFQGNDVSNGLGGVAVGNVFYCASFRPAWVSFGGAMRIDVRVWWERTGITHDAAFQGLLVDFPNCSDTGSAALDPGGALVNDYHVVYLPSVIRMVTVGT